jgi:predicted negative regulator of RcsB-dependent stress response
MADDWWTIDQIEQQIALNLLAQADLQQAMTITAQIDHPELAAANHGAIAVAAWQAGQEPLVTSNFEAALERAAEAGSDNERAQILAQIAANQARAGRRDQAEKTLAMALEAAEQVDIRLQDLLVGRVAEVQAFSGFADQALVTLEGIQGDIWRAFARRTVAVAFARAGDLAHARQAAATLADADLLARVNMAMAAAAHAQGDEGLVTGFLSEAEQRVDELWAKDNRYEMLSDLAVTAAGVDRAPDAVRLARQIMADRDRHLPAIALALAESGEVKYFNQVLSLCAGDLATSLAVCPAIARRHPDQARAVADYVAGQRWS